MKHLGLFEGIGGFSLAGRWAGWETVAWCEWDKHCQRVLKYHFPNAIPHDDITKTDFTRYAGQIDVLTGGFPCQPYSTAGKRLGTEDDRHLWPEMLRAVREVRPRWVVGENVRGLVSWNGGLVFDEVQADLEAEGYEVAAFILPACSVDAPHRRDRVWFVAKNSVQIRRNGYKPKSEPGERKQRELGARDDVRLSDVANTNKGECKEWSHFNGKRSNKAESGAWIHDRITRLSEDGYAANAGESGNYWQRFPTQSPLCSRNDGVPGGLDAITFPKWREFSIGAYGNAIVPQVAFQIFKAINQYEHTKQPDAI